MQVIDLKRCAGLEAAVRGLFLVWLVWTLGACGLISRERVLFDQQGIQIGTESDPSVRRSQKPVSNSHPAQVSPAEIRTLLASLLVSGWSGTLVGIIENPRPIPVFSEIELQRISGPVAAALQQAGPDERVFFSLPNPRATYSAERTAGALFLRGRYLHIVLTDHSAFTRADTAGGEEKDMRDTKGMKLWLAGPAMYATVSDVEEPRWAPFEKVHLSINVKEVLALRGKEAKPAVSTAEAGPPSQAKSAAASADEGVALMQPSGSVEELRLQIRELTTSNLELRDRLADQHNQMQQLKDDLTRLQRELEKSRAKAQPSRKTPPSEQ